MRQGFRGVTIYRSKGFRKNVRDQLCINDKIQIGNHYYSVLADVHSDAGGNAEISV